MSAQAGTRVLTPSPAQRALYATNANRLAKANRIARVLKGMRAWSDAEVGGDVYVNAPALFRWKVARAAGVDVNRAVGDWTWRFACGVARGRAGAGQATLDTRGRVDAQYEPSEGAGQ